MTTLVAVGLLAVLLFVLLAGLVILWRRGPGDLAAWGQFVSTVIRGARPRSASRIALEMTDPPRTVEP